MRVKGRRVRDERMREEISVVHGWMEEYVDRLVSASGGKTGGNQGSRDSE